MAYALYWEDRACILISLAFELRKQFSHFRETNKTDADVYDWSMQPVFVIVTELGALTKYDITYKYKTTLCVCGQGVHSGTCMCVCGQVDANC